MVNFISIQQALEKKSGQVTIHGWVYRERGSANVKFVVLRDFSNIIQCVFNREDFENNWNEIDKITIETSMEITGNLKEEKKAPTGYEIHVTSYKIIQLAEPFPITKDQSPEFLLDNRHLWLRSRKLTSIMKIRSTVLGAIDEFFRNKGYFEFSPPIFTPNACEGGATLFECKFFDDKIYLTQSWQLYAEAAIFALERIYCISPCFRAEKSKTSRHLAEFWMAEMEAAWLNLDEAIKIAEELVVFIVEKVLKENYNELKLLNRDFSKLEKIKLPFYRITYTEALRLLKEKEKIEIPWGKDLRTIEEDLIVKHFDKPVIITNYPKEIMAFYKPADPNDPKTALCFDMLAPEGYGEIIGGSQRETDIEKLKESLKKQGENMENYQWYLDTRRYGSVPHAGFGLGVERLLAWICGLENIKEAIPFPRTMLRKNP